MVRTVDGGEAAVKRWGDSRGLLARVDSVVFDCDGVLIDARRSYDATIIEVVGRMVHDIAVGTSSSPLGSAGPTLIAEIRRSGGFNSDWDTTYALTLFSVAALAEGRPEDARKRLQRIVERFTTVPRPTGRRAVDEFLEKEFPQLASASGRFGLRAARDHLGYPGTTPHSPMTTLFDEIYFGSMLFEEIYGVPSREDPAEGLIDLELPLVREETLNRLAGLVGRGRLALVTGRPFLGTRHSLGQGKMGYFDSGASIFIGDADIDPKLEGEYGRYRKPSGMALIRACEKYSAKVMLYVGDSAEDLMMVRDAQRRLGGRATMLFAGVYSASAEREKQIAFFRRGGSDVILESAEQLPALMEEARR